MTVGERLREARERQKVSLHAIAEKTNISVRFLDAIEKNQFDKLPGGIFTRGFIRSYASQVGLDPDATVEQFLSDEPAQRDDDIDEAPARTQGDGPALGHARCSPASASSSLALALVYLLKPAWLGLQAGRGAVERESRRRPTRRPRPLRADSTPTSASSPAASPCHAGRERPDADHEHPPAPAGAAAQDVGPGSAQIAAAPRGRAVRALLGAGHRRRPDARGARGDRPASASRWTPRNGCRSWSAMRATSPTS